MPSVAQFATFISRLFDMPETTIEAYVKQLRKERVVATKGRGRSAPEMSTMDCVMIISAIMAGSTSRSVEYATALVGSRYWPDDYDDNNEPLMGHAQVAITKALNLGEQHTFGEMFERILERSGGEGIGVYVHDVLTGGDNKGYGKNTRRAFVRIEVYEKTLSANVMFQAAVGDQNENTGIRYVTATFSYMPANGNASPHLVRLSRMAHTTLDALANFLTN